MLNFSWDLYFEDAPVTGDEISKMFCMFGKVTSTKSFIKTQNIQLKYL